MDEIHTEKLNVLNIAVVSESTRLFSVVGRMETPVDTRVIFSRTQINLWGLELDFG